MNKKRLGSIAAAAVLTIIATSANAALIDVSGVVVTPTGAFAALTPPGTPLIGIVDVDDAAVLGGAAGIGDLNAIDINVGGFCFSTQAPSMCPLGGSDVPITSIDGAALTFVGGVVGGSLDVTAFSPTFMVSIPIMLDLTAGTFFADGGALGTVAGTIAASVRASEPALALLLAIGLVAMASVRSRRRR